MRDTPTPSIARFLEGRVAEGGRNQALVQTLCQCRDNDVIQSITDDVIRKAIEVDGLTEQEVTASAASIFASDAREPISGSESRRSNSSVQFIDGRILYTYNPVMEDHARPRQAATREPPAPIVPQGAYDTVSPSPLPEPLTNQTVAFLETVFKPGDMVSIVGEVYTDRGGSIPSGGGITYDRDELIRIISERGNGDPSELWDGSQSGGIYVRINPMMEDGESDREVAELRHALVEWDNIPIDQQWALITASELPCAAVIHSGGSSLHAWVKVDAANKEQFAERVAILHEHFKAYDPDAANKNPSRFSRLPGAIRRDRVTRDGPRQNLLALNIGANSWDEWIEILKDADLPQPSNLRELIEMDTRSHPSNLIGLNGWVRKGGTALIIGQSGIGKSSFTMQMAITFVLGHNFFGMPVVRPLRVMIIQAENDKVDIAEHLQGVINGMGLDEAEREMVFRGLIITSDRTSTGKAFVKRVERQIRKHRPDVVFADPLVSYAGGDISRQEVCAELLRNGGLNEVLERTNVAWFWVHHTGKPPKGKDKPSSMSVGDYSYVGLGSSDLTNWARAIMVVSEVPDQPSERLFEVILPKRGERAGFTDINGTIARSKFYMKHAEGRIHWIHANPPAEPEQVERGRSNAYMIANSMLASSDTEIRTMHNGFRARGSSDAVACYLTAQEFRQRGMTEVTAQNVFDRLYPDHGDNAGAEERLRDVARFAMNSGLTVDAAVRHANSEWAGAGRSLNQTISQLELEINDQ